MADQPISDVVNSLPLHEQVKEALVDDPPNYLAKVLSLVVACEKYDWPVLTQISKEISISPQHSAKHYLDAIEWADRTVQAA